MLKRYAIVLLSSLLIISFGVTSSLGYILHSIEIHQAENEQVQSQLLNLALNRSDTLNKNLKTVEATLKQREEEVAKKQAELDAATRKIKDQQSQISANASELSTLRNHPPLFSFSVDSQSIQNVEQKKEDIKALVTAAYNVMTDIYGAPYLLHAVTIDFVDTLSNTSAAAEINITNGSTGLSLTIKLTDFDKNDFNAVNVIIHEIFHSFHGLAALDPVAYEEGITVAATDAVMVTLISQGKIPNFSPLYIRISQSDYETSSVTVPRDRDAFYNSSDVAMHYQLVGYGWYQLYKSDTNFFKNFNEKIYDKKRNGEEITESVVRQAILDVFHSTVQGKSTSEWLNTKGFNLT